ncbi:MAG TPA: tyrosine-protein phosphatase [Phenylobacterium sp.]|uniref:tyrosine-protein phosphatase n=1 Tax=Phenylobacterium sp. TaxID=1871053 RepID=UPI002CCD1B2E|nr:tyrosine-protein phosphatase [Phenylobacterium sp.]HSV03013.1 tyrosine-protein phosphatase [Phenylobacterium sp.]
MSRHIDFDGIENFRDFGGYPTTCGRGLKSARLYRSGAHHMASEADLARLRGLGVSVVVDLRQPHERKREPSRRWAGFDAAVIENDIVSEHPDWLDKLKLCDLSAGWFFEDTRNYYRLTPFEARYTHLYSAYFRALGEAEGAVIVHCAAGKDRTGIACALTHHIAGVHPDDIMADFLLTNDETRIERKMAALEPYFAAHLGRTASPEAVRTAVSVFPEYLETAFASMRERYGSVEAYLEQALGVDRALRERIRHRLLDG